MKTGITLSAFAKYARLVLAYNIVVILWGVFLRASKSGDGCGQFWLTCNGEVVPSAPELKTVIEFSHRISSGVAFVAVLALLIWAFHKFEKGNPVRKTALVSFVFIITEALVGAGLVLTGNTAEALTSARPFWAIGHLTNTFVLLAFLSLTAWFASTGRSTSLNAEPKTLLLMGMAVIALLLVGMSGSVAALSSMLFPSVSVSEGIVKDYNECLYYISCGLAETAAGHQTGCRLLVKYFIRINTRAGRFRCTDSFDTRPDHYAARSSALSRRYLDQFCIDVCELFCKTAGGRQ